MKPNWSTLAAWAGVIAMVILFAMDKFGGNADAMDGRVKCLETKTAVLESTLSIELKNMSERMRSLEIAVRSKIK